MKKISLFILTIILNTIAFGQNYTDIEAIDSNVCFLLKRDNVFVVTKDGGKTWNNIQLPTENYYSKIEFINEKSGLLLGPFNMLLTIDGGANWKVLNYDESYTFGAVKFLDDSTFFAGGIDTGYSSYLVYSDDLGASWRKCNVDTLRTNTGGILDIEFYNNSIGLANDMSAVYKTTDGGVNWTKLPKEYNGFFEGIESTQILSDSIYILQGWEGDFVPFGFLHCSSNGGENWYEYNNSSNFIYSIKDYYFKSMNEGYVSNQQKLLYTNTSGDIWDTLDVKINRFDFIDDISWGFSDSTVMKTTDGWLTYELIDIVTSVNDPDLSYPLSFKLFDNYPNPFNPSTTIKYELPQNGKVKLIVYDLLGREVKTLVNGFKQKGRYEISFDASQLSSGVYIYRISANEFSASRKMVLLK